MAPRTHPTTGHGIATLQRAVSPVRMPLGTPTTAPWARLVDLGLQQQRPVAHVGDTLRVEVGDELAHPVITGRRHEGRNKPVARRRGEPDPEPPPSPWGW